MPLGRPLRPPQLQATIDPQTGRIIYTPVDAGPQVLPAPQFTGMGLPDVVQRAAADVPSTPVTFSGNRVSGGPSPLEALGAMDIPFRAAGDVAYEQSGSPAIGALAQAGLGIASPGAVTRGARFLGKAAAERLPGALENIAGKMGTQMYAVKPRGGQWIEPDLSDLISSAGARMEPGRQATLEELMGSGAKEGVVHTPLSTYVDKNLRKWIKTSMDTEETDALAKELGLSRATFDEPISSIKAGKYQAIPKGKPGADVAQDNPWIMKMDPKEAVHYLSPAMPESITQMFDYLRTVAPEKLKNIAVPDALRQSKAWHDAIAKKQTEEALKAGSLTTHREYPTGFKWQEIVKPDALPEGYKVEKGTAASFDRIIGPDGRVAGVGPEAIERIKSDLLAQGLDAEGKMMGHCVGSYCEQVSGGGTRIFSLRDPSGKPHVTVEVNPAWQSETGMEVPLHISQIKGKQNAAPVAEYLPYVQDFVKNSPLGAPWGDVQDLRNAGLVKQGGRFVTQGDLDAFHAAGNPGALPRDEYNQAFEEYMNSKEGHAAGGAVDIDDDAVEHLRGLFAAGGAVDIEPEAEEYLQALLEAA